MQLFRIKYEMARLLFVGDSLIEFYDWRRRFPEHTTVEMGISGETVEELLHRTGSITRSVSEPDFVIIMSGINNAAMEDYSFGPAYLAVLRSFRTAWPGASVIVNSLLPVDLPWIAPDNIRMMNENLKAAADNAGAVFLDVYSSFLDKYGRLIRELLSGDGVHLSERGYAAWSGVLQDEISRHGGGDVPRAS